TICRLQSWLIASADARARSGWRDPAVFTSFEGETDARRSAGASSRVVGRSVVQRKDPVCNRDQVRLDDVGLIADEQGRVTGTRDECRRITCSARAQRVPGVRGDETERLGLDAEFACDGVLGCSG